MRLDTHTIVATVCPQCTTKLSPGPHISTGICRTRTLTCVDVCACPLSPPPPLCYSSPALFPSLPPFSFPASWPSLSPSLAPLPCASLSPVSSLPSPLRVRRLNILYVQKQASVPKCGDCGTKLRGMKALRPNQLKNSITSKRQKHVTRAYGGARSLSPAPPLPPPSLSLSVSCICV